MEMSWEIGVICGLSAIVAVFLVCWWFRVDTKWEKRQEMCQELSRTCTLYGFKRIASICDAGGRKDLSGFVSQWIALAKDMTDADQAADILRGPIRISVPRMLKNPEERGWLLEAVREAGYNVSPAWEVDGGPRGSGVAAV